MIRLFTFLACVLAVSCSGGNSGGSGGGGAGGNGGSGGGTGLTADEACNNLAVALCSKTDSCTPFATSIYYGDASACAARSKLSCVPALALSSTGATPAKIDACAKAVAALGCSDNQLAYSLPDCVFKGTLAAGTACGSNSQCVGGYCRFTSSTCGVCSSRNAAGGSCTAAADCVAGATCVNGTCATQLPIGMACSASKPCKLGLYCKAGSCAAAGTMANTPCDSNITESCNFLAGFFCGQSNVCVKSQVANTGSACGLSATNYTECTYGGTCNTSGGTVGTCVAAVLDGQACDSTNALNCLAPATCENGTCKLTNPGSCL